MPGPANEIQGGGRIHPSGLGRTKVMFFAEAVTLAHLARPISLARSLDPDRYEIVIAADPRCDAFLRDGPWQHVPMTSLASSAFLAALARGKPVYDYPTLTAYVAEDLYLLQAHRPDLVVGDFRLSLSVSARKAKIPYCTITNGYWSSASVESFPMPELPMTRWLPLPVAETLFRIAAPLAMHRHCKALNRIRRQHGMTEFGADIRRLYTDADHVLRADAYPLVSEADLPKNQSHLGPLAWAPAVSGSEWWDALNPEIPIVYVTLGSSGSPKLLDQVLKALADLPLQVVASSAGAPAPASVPANARVCTYMDGQSAARRARLVICNGGSPSTQQALTEGVPVLGLPSNMDQMFNMRSVCELGAGISLRADRATVKTIRASALELLASNLYLAIARHLAIKIGEGRPAAQVFDEVVQRLVRR